MSPAAFMEYVTVLSVEKGQEHLYKWPFCIASGSLRHRARFAPKTGLFRPGCGVGKEWGETSFPCRQFCGFGVFWGFCGFWLLCAFDNFSDNIAILYI